MKKKSKVTSPYQETIEALKNTKDDNELLSKLIEYNSRYGSLKYIKKDDIEHWTEVLSRFETFFQNLKSSFEEQEVFSQDKKLQFLIPKQTGFPRDLLLTNILTFARFLLQISGNNSSFENKKVFPLLEHLNTLLDLAVEDNVIRIEVLKVLLAYVKKTNPHSRRALPEVYLDASIQEKLLALAQGWNGKETGLTISACCDDRLIASLPLHFEFYISENKEHPETTGHHVIHVDNVHTYQESSFEIFKQLLKKFPNIPQKYHYPLFARINLSKSFPNPSSENNLFT